MSDQVRVRLEVDLPVDLALQVDAVQETEPEFLSRVVRYALQRRMIYLEMRRIHEQLIEEAHRIVSDDDESGGKAR